MPEQNLKIVHFLCKLPLPFYENVSPLKVKGLSFSSFAFFRVLKLEPDVE